MNWWKIYFWILTLIGILAVIILYVDLEKWLGGDWIILGLMAIELIGLYAYIYKKSVFNPTFWRLIFWLSIAITAWDILYNYTALENIISYPTFLATSLGASSPVEYFIGLVLEVPILYAIYQLGKPQKNKKSK